MSFRAVQHTLDAMARSGMLRGEWAYLLWVARNADDKTLHVTRSQERIAAELGITARQVRTYQARWTERGVIDLLHRGGSRMKLPSKYAINLEKLNIFVGGSGTPEVRVPVIHETTPNAPSNFRSSPGSPEVSERNSGSPGLPPLRSVSDQKKTDLESAAEPSLAGASSAAPDAEPKADQVARARKELARLRETSGNENRRQSTTAPAERIRKARKHLEADPQVGDDVLAKSYHLTPDQLIEARNP